MRRALTAVSFYLAAVSSFGCGDLSPAPTPTPTSDCVRCRTKGGIDCVVICAPPDPPPALDAGVDVR